MRHPALRGFTYYTGNASASRLDAIWTWAPPGVSVRVLNAAVLWGWQKRTDHEPALLDLLLELPELLVRVTMVEANFGEAWCPRWGARSVQVLSGVCMLQ